MNEQTSNFFPGADIFTRMWSDFASKSMGAGVAFTPNSTPPEAARQMRSAMFQAWTEYCDQFMRSAEFLDMMKQSLAASIQARKQLNDFLGQVHHEFQGVSRQDMDQIMLSLRHLERRLLDSLERVSGQLDDLGQRLNKLENRSKSGGGRTRNAAAKDGGDEEL